MNNYKHGDWYCKPSNEAEAREIVERAVASGAELFESVGEGTDKYRWNLRKYWGVMRGSTINFHDVKYANDTIYTIEKIREKFPLPGELKKPDQGDGVCLPLVGSVWVHNNSEIYRVTGYANQSTTKPEQYPVTIIYQNVDNNTVWCRPASEWARSFKTEREQFIGDVHDGYDGGAHHSTVMDIAGRIYDALKSGDLKAPE